MIKFLLTLIVLTSVCIGSSYELDSSVFKFKTKQITRATDVDPIYVARATDVDPIYVARATDVDPIYVARATDVDPIHIALATDVDPIYVAIATVEGKAPRHNVA